MKCMPIIKELLSLRAVMQHYGVRFNRAGFAACPFHNEKTASMSIKSDKYYKCFGCGAKGDVIDFTANLFGITNGEAARKLNEDFGLNLPLGRNITAEVKQSVSKRMDELKNKKTEAENMLRKLTEEYNRAFDCWVSADKAVRQYADFTSERCSRAYALAIHELPIAEHRLNVAEMKLNRFISEGKC